MTGVGVAVNTARVTAGSVVVVFGCDELITRTYAITDAPQAFADLDTGMEGRGVIVFDT